MTARGMRAQDIAATKWVLDVQVSHDGGRLAWTEVSLDEAKDAPVSRIIIGQAAGRQEPRPFTFGPSQFSPRFSPDGAYLAFLGAEDAPPSLFLAPLDGGQPRRVDTGGPVSWISWAPDGRRVALLVQHDMRAPGDSPVEKNRAIDVRGSFNRMDGQGALSGRAHVVVCDVESGALTQLTRGDYDCEQPSFSPDSRHVVYLSDRSARRNDVIGRADLFVVPADGGQPRRLAQAVGAASHPTFSPEGRAIAVVGVEPGGGIYGRSRTVMLIDARGRGELRRAFPDVDHHVAEGLSPSAPYAWLSETELAFTVNERGAVGIVRARIGSKSLRRVVAGERSVGNLSIGGPRATRTLAFTSAWVEGVPDVRVRPLSGTGAGRAVTDNLAEVRDRTSLAPAQRHRTRSPDGLSIEYFVLKPTGGDGPWPCVVDVHGGPQMSHPFVEISFLYQCLIGAGYAVVLPNPRGSLGYGESFSRAVVGDWGGEDFADIMAVCDDAIARRIADERRLYLSGYSYGGYMTSWAVTQTDRFRAAVIGAPVTNLISMVGASDVGANLSENTGGTPWHESDLVVERSPITHTANVRTPVLIHVSEGDLRCPVSQSDELYVALRLMRKSVEYVRYPGGSHLAIVPFMGAPSQNADRVSRILDYLAKHGGTRRSTAKQRSDRG